MPKRSPQEQALHQAQQPIYEALVLRKEIADLKRKLEELTTERDYYREQYHDANSDLRDLRARADALAGALEDLRKRAIILSDDYLKVFESEPDSDEVQGWELGRWRRLSETAKESDAALTAYRNREEGNE